jgi:hypothetical protein
MFSFCDTLLLSYSLPLDAFFVTISSQKVDYLWSGSTHVVFSGEMMPV